MPTWDDVAVAVGKDVRQVHRWRKNPDAPIEPDPEAWRDWLSARAGLKSAEKAAASGVANDAALPGECDYDDLVRAGKLTYALAKVREQVIAEKIANETKRIEQAKIRGALVTREEADRGCALVRDSLTQRYDRSLARALARLSDQLSPEIRAEIVKALDAELDAE